jgi:hypothetical protein
MKKQLLAIGAVALAVFATQQTAQAGIVEESAGNLVADSPGSPTPLVVSYEVLFDLNSSLYTYLYSFTAFGPTPVNGPVTQFTVNASYVNSIITGTSVYSSSDLSSVWWDFGTANQPTLETVGFTSYFAPINGTGSANDEHLGTWDDVNQGTPIPVPGSVPEASTVMAGALMLLPFGIGAIRSLRRERTV